jgi:hypothetical protein
MRKKIGVCLFLLCAVNLLARSRSEIPPDKVESVLSSISNRPPIIDEEWLKIIGQKKSQTYTVEKGDTLWDISKKVFNNARLWPKFWSVNQVITNPHEIEVGTVLAYYKEPSRNIATNASDSPQVVKLKPARTDIDMGVGYVPDIKNRSFPPVFVLGDDEKILGKVSGAYTEKKWVGVHDLIYLDIPDKENVKVGDIFSAIHFEENLWSGLRLLGKQVRYLGDLKVVAIGENHVLVERKSEASRLERGDWIISQRHPIEWTLKVDPPKEFTSKVLKGEFSENTLFKEGSIIIVDKGAKDGMKDGYYFRVYKDEDPFNSRSSTVESHYKGEIQIISTGDIASIGYITKNTDPIQVGDLLLPRQLFADPAKTEKKALQNLNFD